VAATGEQIDVIGSIMSFIDYFAWFVLFEASTKKYPLIAMGTPDPYAPPGGKP
jgi:hypothetical protein